MSRVVLGGVFRFGLYVVGIFWGLVLFKCIGVVDSFLN